MAGLSCGLAACIWQSLPAATLRADWPEFRGPNKQGIVESRRLPVEWSATANVRWRTELPGEGWSSPIVVGEQIFLTAAVPGTEGSSQDAYRLSALILDATSGELKREVKLFEQPSSAPRIHQKNSHASPTPVFDGEHVYVHFGHQGTACINQAGDVLWRNDSLGYPPVHGNGGSPVVFEDLLIFSRDGADIAEVVALDKRTGELRWRTPRDVAATRQFSFCTPLVLEIDGRTQLIFPGSNVVQSLDPRSGKEHWRVTYEGYSVIPRPIYESGLVFICTGYDRAKLLAIDPTGAGDVTNTHLKWQVGTAVPFTPSLIGDKGRVFMISDNGIASCLNAMTGEERWKERIGGNFSASPLLVGDLLYMLSEDGVATALRVSGDAPQRVAQNKMEERSLASFALVDNDLLLRSAKALYRIGQ
jgi:outer membrane protein assembly factor BamB